MTVFLFFIIRQEMHAGNSTVTLEIQKEVFPKFQMQQVNTYLRLMLFIHIAIAM